MEEGRVEFTLGCAHACNAGFIVLQHGEMTSLREAAKGIKTDVQALLLAAADPRVPITAKLLGMVVVAYALSPIDLIPDFIPILGYLDDLILVPLGVRIVIRMIPVDVWTDLKNKAANQPKRSTRARYLAALIIIGLWVFAVMLFWNVIHTSHRKNAR